MLPWLTELWGNPSGVHSVARAARSAVDDARETVARVFGTDAGEVIFTAGGTEADNLAVLGYLARRPGPVVISAVEHHAVLHAAEASGHEVRTVAVRSDGTVDLDSLKETLDESVQLVSVMTVNNEVGTVQPLHKVSRLVRRRAPGAVLHTDAVQAVEWLDLGEIAKTVDALSISAHKFGGPQGVGALVLNRGVAQPAPVIHGGGQERDRRSGTHNVAGIVGMAAALEAVTARKSGAAGGVTALRDRLSDAILTGVPDSVETGPRDLKAPGHCHLRFAGVESEALLLLLDDAGVCASAGSACTSGAIEASHVLLAMGVPEHEALGSLRLTLGPRTTAAEVDRAATAVIDAVGRLRDRAARRDGDRVARRKKAS